MSLVSIRLFCTGLLRASLRLAAPLLVAQCATGWAQTLPAATPILVSRSAGAGGATSEAAQPSISADGRYIAFWSDAPDLVAGDTNGVSDVFVFDTFGGTTLRASVSAGGLQGTQASVTPSISANGRY